MSYSRWSNSNWYCFYNVTGQLSLWHCSGDYMNWDAEALSEFKEEDIKRIYECDDADAKEAMTYIGYFLEEYDEEENAKMQEEYNQEIMKLLAMGDKNERTNQ